MIRWVGGLVVSEIGFEVRFSIGGGVRVTVGFGVALVGDKVSCASLGSPS